MNPSNPLFWTALTAIAEFAQFVVLVVSAYFVWGYLNETSLIRKAAQRQVEASFHPVIVVTHSGSMESEPKIENIGNGPAMDVSWRLKESKWKGTIPYLPRNQPRSLPLPGVKPLYEVPGAVIECYYRSVSGVMYRSRNLYDINKYYFTTTFSDGELM